MSMLHPTVRQHIIMNCQGKRRNQYQPLGDERVFQKLTAPMMVDLLEDAASRPTGYSIPGETPESTRKYVAKELLDAMRNHDWTIRAGVHEGGVGDANRAPDPNPHITLQVHRKSYHLTCKEDPTLHIIQITD
ncbi:hypothetical protein F0U62_24100 [Cystobacter fuscus]|uniref:hypothetical protein n=1 Tax=Cystobacter fuscus TaxID=43 RepID=UPI002B2E5EC1|nr:hypothetical protein F0U62_24100 [Cystobacter fuscus]